MSYGPFKINGTAIPTPNEYVYGVEDLSSQQTGRTLDGVMHKDVVAVKDYYDCAWRNLSWADTALILNAIDGKPKINFTYADPRYPNSFVTNEFYVGSRTGKAVDLKRKVWGELKFRFIRV